MTKITYNGKTTELADGYIATLPCKDLKMETDVVVEAPEGAEAPTVEEWDGSGVVIEGLLKLISFTVDGTSYQAESGMTWEQFISSEYNPDTGYTNRPKKFTTIGTTGVGYAWDEYNTFPVREPNSYYDEVTTNVIKPIEYESYNPSDGGGVN